MRWKGRRGSSNVIDKRGKGKVAKGGGLAFLGIAAVVYFMGGDPTMFLQEGISRTMQSGSVERSVLTDEQQVEMGEFVSVVLAETEDTWSRKFKERGQTYPKPKLVMFTGAVQSACGNAQSAMGPFYCPLDQRIYIDLSFFHDLKTRHGAPGDFAQAYVIAHEAAHHIQNITGVLDKTHKAKKTLPKREANQISVRTELMADCLAGVWAADTARKGLLEDGDIREALNAASQIGDDTLQKQSHGHVVPDSFTHGSGEQRYRWFNKGFESGNMDVCDTFAVRDL